MSRDNRPHRTSERLSLEQLESRVNPADFWWSPGSGGSAGVAANWMKGPGIPYALWDRLPGPQDDLYFRGDVSTANCVIPDQPDPPSPAYPYAFHGVHLQFELVTVIVPIFGPPPPPPIPRGYTGTVTIQDSLAVGTLEVDCGTIKQADPSAPTGTAGTLTIASTLDWTGGTLNSNTVAGTISLAPGATGTIAPSFTNPGINGTVYLGSTLELQGIPEDPPAPSLGSTLTMTDGTYELDGGSFLAQAGSLLIMAPVPKTTPNKGTPDIFVNNVRWTDPTVTVKAGATAKVTSVGRVNNTEPVDVEVKGGNTQFHNMGTTIIDSYTRLNISKGGANFAEYLQTKPALAAAPITTLQAGSAIIAKDDGDPTKGFVYITAGELEIKGVPGVADADQPEALIQVPNKLKAPALFVTTDGKITVGPPFSPLVTLKVEGDMTCEGDVSIWANRSAAENSHIVATGVMKFRPGATPSYLKVYWRNPGGALAGVNTKWTFLQSDDAARGGIAPIPTLTPPVEQLPVVLSQYVNFTSDYGMERTA